MSKQFFFSFFNAILFFCICIQQSVDYARCYLYYVMHPQLISICTSAELFISKVSLMKLKIDIRHWETSANIKMFASRQKTRQNKRTNQIIIKKRTKTKWSKKFLILKSVQKWNELERVFAQEKTP